MTSPVSAGMLAPSSFCWMSEWVGGGVRGVCVCGGGTDCGDCGRKVSTQRKHACVFAGSDGESAKGLHLHSVAVCTACIMGVGKEGRGDRLTLS